MTSALQDFFSSYEKTAVTSECHQQLGVLLKQISPRELEQFLLTYRPKEFHLQLLRGLVARASNCHSVLLEGFRDESKEVSRFCVESSALYCNADGGDNQLYDPKFLVPLLQKVSYRTRKSIVKNLGKHMPNGRADELFDAVANVWDPATAAPLLCRTSEALLRREQKRGHSVSSFQLLTIARRFPGLALAYLETAARPRHSLKAARYVIRVNIPESLSYCVKNSHQQLLSKSAMKFVLRKHLDVVMAAPSEWATVLDIECVKKVLKPNDLETFFLKQLQSEIGNTCISYRLTSAMKHLSRSTVSSLMKKAGFTEKENFWANNVAVLELLEHSERSIICSSLFAKTKNLDWVPLMTCDLSIPLLKENLRSEAVASVRARLVDHLLSTVATNEDQKALEEICQFVGVRYRNDRDVLCSFFENLPDLRSVGEETWTIVYTLANKFNDSVESYYNYGVNRIFSTALKRNGKSGLKIYIDRCFSAEVGNSNRVDDFSNIEPELREECISMVFTDANVASTEHMTIRILQDLLSAITKWNSSSTQAAVKFENVNKFILNNLENQSVIEFVLGKKNGFKTDFLLQCFELSGDPRLLRSIMQKHRGKLTISNAAITKMGETFISAGVWKYISLLKALKKRGNFPILQCLSELSSAAIRDPDCRNPRHAVLLLSLTSVDVNTYLNVIDPFLADTDLTVPFAPNPEPSDSEVQEQSLKQSQRKGSIYKGIGNSFSHIDRPTGIVGQLLKFCTNGDLMLFVRDSVYSVCFSLPALATKDLLASLMDKPVSVKKHALRIHRLVCDIETQRDFLLALVDSEQHITTRTVLLEYALSSLHNSERVEIWQAVKEMMTRLTPKDKALVTLLATKRVPSQFWEEYIKLLLEKSESLEDNDIAFVSTIVERICCWFATMPISNQFQENLITDYFLSNRYFPAMHSHSYISGLCIAYLGTQSQANDDSVVEHKKHFLLERLNFRATHEALNAYDEERCCYPTRVLLNAFVKDFNTNCVQQRKDGKNNLGIFTAPLISFLTQFGEYLLFGSYVRMSLTAIMTRQVQEKESSGYLIGQFIDGVFAKNPGLAQYALPALVVDCGLIQLAACLNEPSEPADFLQELLRPPQPHDSATLQLRQLIVTQILPAGWQKEKSLADFRIKFMALVKNTPSEVILFS